MRSRHHRALPWHAGWPVSVHGRLPDGQPFAVAFGLDTDGPAADYALTSASWYVGGEPARRNGTSGVTPGAANHAHGGRARALCWLVDDPVERLVLDTDRGELDVAAVHHDEQLAIRVFLAVVEDPEVGVRQRRTMGAWM